MSLKMSNYFHIGNVGRQPRQCKCVLCGESMKSTEECRVCTHPSFSAFIDFVLSTHQWRSKAESIGESGNASDEHESAAYQIFRLLGPRRFGNLKITQTTAELIKAHIEAAEGRKLVSILHTTADSASS